MVLVRNNAGVLETYFHIIYRVEIYIIVYVKKNRVKKSFGYSYMIYNSLKYEVSLTFDQFFMPMRTNISAHFQIYEIIRLT